MWWFWQKGARSVESMRKRASVGRVIDGKQKGWWIECSLSARTLEDPRPPEYVVLRMKMAAPKSRSSLGRCKMDRGVKVSPEQSIHYCLLSVPPMLTSWETSASWDSTYLNFKSFFVTGHMAGQRKFGHSRMVKSGFSRSSPSCWKKISPRRFYTLACLTWQLRLSSSDLRISSSSSPMSSQHYLPNLSIWKQKLVHINKKSFHSVSFFAKNYCNTQILIVVAASHKKKISSVLMAIL